MKTLLILFIIFASFLKGADTMKTVESVDLEKFMGCLLYTSDAADD